MSQRHLVDPKGRYINILCEQTGRLMLKVSTAQGVIAEREFSRLKEGYPDNVFRIVRTNSAMPSLDASGDTNH